MSKTLQLFYGGTDGRLWSRARRVGGDWSDDHTLHNQADPWGESDEKVAGNIAAAPVPGTNILQILYRLGDGALWTRARDGDPEFWNSHWSDPQRLGGMVTTDISTAQVPGTNILQVFYRGGDGGVRSFWRDGNTWYGEQNLGGVATSAIAAAQIPGSNVLALFYRGANGGVCSLQRAASGSWSSEQSLGGTVTGNIIAVQVPGTDILELYYRGGDGGLFSRVRYPDSGTWSHELPWGAQVTSDITVGRIPTTDLLQVFYRGIDGGLCVRLRLPTTAPDSVFIDEVNLGGKVTSAITAAPLPATNVLQLFYRGGDGALWSRWRDGLGDWSGDQGLGGATATDITAVQLPG
jgi:hypothetical protein